MNVDLIYPASKFGSENYSTEPPLGPIALYSSIPKIIRGDVRFLDSTLMPQAEIDHTVTQCKSEVVAMSCTTFNYPNVLRLAELAKLNGSIVVLGGIHVTYMHDAILTKMAKAERPIDYLVRGYGEPAFGPLLDAIAAGKPVTDIPNLSFIDNGRIVRNPVDRLRFGTDPLTVPLDTSNIDYSLYSRGFRAEGKLSHVRIVASTFTQRGCIYSGSRKCTFCSIEQINPRRSPELFEQDVINLVTRYRADHIRINDGDFTANIRHMAHIADAAERAFEKVGKRPVFHCFTRADELDEERIALLKRLNVVAVFIGYESGSDEMLRGMQKHTTREQNLRATELLKKHGIDVVCAGLVLGAEGESETTLRETMDFVRELKEIGNTWSLVASPLIPLPGSPSFSTFLSRLRANDPGKARELAAADVFDVQELVELWNRHHCRVSLDRVIDVCDEIESLFQIGIRFAKFKHPEK